MKHKRVEWNEYHITRTLRQRGAQVMKSDRRREFVARVNYTKKYYRGRFDPGHAYFMSNALAYDFNYYDKLQMPLDACIALGNVQNQHNSIRWP